VSVSLQVERRVGERRSELAADVEDAEADYEAIRALNKEVQASEG
jgi:hypothetical protein